MKNKKGFTLVELVIVIAVIAILAAVLIPTFAGILARAKDSTNMQVATNARDELLSANLTSSDELHNYVVLKDGKFYTFDNSGNINLSESETLADFEESNNVQLTLMSPSNVSLEGVDIYIIGEVFDTSLDELVAIKNAFIEKYNISSNFDKYFIKLGDDIYTFNADSLSVSTLTKSEIEDDAGYFFAERPMANTLGATFYYLTDIPFVAYQQPGIICDGVSYTWQQAIDNELIYIENNVLISVPDPDSNDITYFVVDDSVIIDSECYGISDFGTVYDGGRYIASSSNPYKFLVGFDWDFDGSVFNICEITEYVSTIYYYGSGLSVLTVPSGIKDFDASEEITKNLDSYNLYNGVYYIGNEYDRYVIACMPQDENTSSCTIHPDTKIIGYSAFSNLSNLESVTLNDGLRIICGGAFGNTSSLTEVTIPGSCIRIGRGAFSQSGLVNVTINDGVKYIEPSAFAYCYTLQTCVLPNTLIKLGGDAFYKCYQLNGITLPETLVELGGMCFDSCYSLTSINIPSGITELYIQTFRGCPITSITLPEGLTCIRQSALPSSITNTTAYGNALYIGTATNPYFCLYKSAMDSTHTVLTVHEDCKIIYPEVFYNNSYITAATIPASVTWMGSGIFSKCSNLVSVTFEDGFNLDLSGIFMNCTNLTTVILPEDYSGELGNSLFYGCTSLTSFTIPVNVRSITNTCFQNSGLETLTVLVGDGKDFGSQCVNGCTALTTIIFKEASASYSLYFGYNCWYVSSNVNTDVYTDLDTSSYPLNSIGSGTNRTVTFHTLAELGD